jgi:hypothetical protein
VQKSTTIDVLFRQAVSAIDAGDMNMLEQLLIIHPLLVRERLHAPGDWLRDKVGKTLDGFFRQPYLLWFVAEDPVRNGRLPGNIVEITRTIVQAAQRQQVASLAEQLDYALLLTAWSRVAHNAGVQIELMDVLIDADASPKGVANNALINGHFAAAAHAIQRGDPLTLASALCLEHWDAVPALATAANPGQRQFSLILTALNGRAEAIARLIPYGVDINGRCPDLHSHGTALHHAAVSGSLDAVKVLIEAGADINAIDTAWNGTPLGWAIYGKHDAIADYLRSVTPSANSSPDWPSPPGQPGS